MENKNKELELVLNYILNESRGILNEGTNEIDEGFIAKTIGAIGGATIGVALMKKLCNILGVKEGALLYNLLTSKVIAGSVGAILTDSMFSKK